MALTEKMKSFCREYMKNGGNGTQAYLVAYDTDNAVVASRESYVLLKRDDIADYIKTLNLPLETKAISEREKKRAVLWSIIESPDSSNADRCRALDILNKMDTEYININRNVTETETAIDALDVETLKKLAGDA